MPQQHLDRLTSIDASFLAQEGRSSHMHIGGVLIFQGPPPDFVDFLEHVRSRLHLVPRYRQKLAVPPLESGRPLWIDDASFNLEYHVRHSALPAPGDEEQLFRLAGRIASQQLDRERPLWETWLVEGLEDDRFALISKTHHSLVDGISGVDLATVLFDTEPNPAPSSENLEPWRPEPEPSPADLVMAGARGMIRTTAGLVTRAIGAATRPATSLNIIRDALEGVGEIVWAGLNPAPETPLNIEIGPHRRYAVSRQRLADYKEIKDALGGTVNDVVLTIVAGALARWLRSRGVRTEGLEMRALVPVSVRGQDQRGTLGNQLVAMRGPLPVYIDDPVARLDYVRTAMNGLKESKQAVGAATLAQVTNLAPPTVLAQASRLNFSTRLFNLIVTNVPGPQLPLYVLGRQLEDLFPVAFLPENHGLAIAIMSYNGALDYGLLGDYDALPDIDLIVEGLDESLGELLEAARGGSRRSTRSSRSSRSTRGSRQTGGGATRRRMSGRGTNGNGAGGRGRAPGGSGAAASGAAASGAAGSGAAGSAGGTAGAGAGGSAGETAGSGAEAAAPALDAGSVSEAPESARTAREPEAPTTPTPQPPESIISAAAHRSKEGPAADMRAKRTAARRRPSKPTTD